MAHTHEFDCRICGAHLDSKQELDQHNQKQHTAQASGGSSSGASSASSSGGSSSSGNDRNISNR